MKGILFKPDMIKAIVEGRKTQTRRLSGLKEINQEPDMWEWNSWQESQMWCRHFDSFWFDHINLTHQPRRLEIKPHYQVGDVVYIKEAHYRWGHWLKAGLTKSGRQAWFLLPDSRYEVLYNDNPPLFDTDKTVTGWFKRSPLFMPAWAARYFIKITDVRAERLQEITEEDAVAEGTIRYPDKIRQGHIYRALSDYVYEAYPLKWGFNKGEKLKADFPSLGLARFYSLDKHDGQCIHLHPKEAFSLLEDEELTYRDAYFNLWNSINPKYPWESNPWIFRYEFTPNPK